MSSSTTYWWGGDYSVSSRLVQVNRYELPTWPIVGRDAEVVRILDGLARGVGAVVVGEAGLGKSALVAEVHRRLTLAGQMSRLIQCSGHFDFPLHNAAGESLEVASDRQQTLIVDDAHLLDHDSANLLWRLARQTPAQVVATIRSGEPVPDSVTRLWTGGSSARMDLNPLTVEDIGQLLEVVLGGDVEDRLPRVLATRSAGNALLLREFVRSGLETAAIVRSGRVWTLAGDLTVGVGVANMIRAGLAELDGDQLEAAQLIAIGEPLRLDAAEQMISAEVLESLENKRVATLAHTVDGPVLTLGHPLYGDVLRADIAALRLRRLRRTLINAFEVVSAPTPHDRLRSVVWRRETGDSVSEADLLAAAALARVMSPSTAERLARAALALAGSVDSTLLLADILVVQGRVAEADAFFDDLDLETLSVAERNAVTYGRALGQTRLGELSNVIALITGDEVDARATSGQLQAIYGQAILLDGRIDEAIEVLNPLCSDPATDPTTYTIAACCLVLTGVLNGRSSETYRLMQYALPITEAVRAEIPFGPGNLQVAGSICLANAGRLSESEAIARRMYDRALVDDDEWLSPRGASALGVAALLRGQPRTATRYFRITLSSLDRLDGQYLRYNSSLLARGAALAGYVDEARQALRAAEDSPNFPIFSADWQIAEATLLAACRDFVGASDVALTAARYAASLGHLATMSHAANDAVRYSGSPEAAALVVAAAEAVDGPLYGVLADFAQARVADDPGALTSTSLKFEQMGTILYSVEASYLAARAHRREGAGRAAAAATIRAAALHARCENATIPWASGFQAFAVTGEVLTQREQQVSLMAAAGHPDSQIATQLQISVRTVQNHLSRAYRKLAITNRQDLPAALTGE